MAAVPTGPRGPARRATAGPGDRPRPPGWAAAWPGPVGPRAWRPGHSLQGRSGHRRQDGGQSAWQRCVWVCFGRYAADCPSAAGRRHSTQTRLVHFRTPPAPVRHSRRSNVTAGAAARMTVWQTPRPPPPAASARRPHPRRHRPGPRHRSPRPRKRWKSSAFCATSTWPCTCRCATRTKRASHRSRRVGFDRHCPVSG